MRKHNHRKLPQEVPITLFTQAIGQSFQLNFSHFRQQSSKRIIKKQNLAARLQTQLSKTSTKELRQAITMADKNNTKNSSEIVKKLRINYNIVAIRTMVEANNTMERSYYLKPEQLVLVKDNRMGKFTTDGDHFILGFNNKEAVVASEEDHPTVININDIFPMKGWVIKDPERAWNNLQN